MEEKEFDYKEKCIICGFTDTDKFTEKELDDEIAETIFGCIDEKSLGSSFQCSFIEGDIEDNKYILHIAGHRFGDREYELKLFRKK